MTKAFENYSDKYLNNLKNTLLKVTFTEIDIDDKSGFVKDKVIEAIDLCCPLMKAKNKNNNCSPWFDEELNSSKKYRDNCHNPNGRKE
ncbi:unnamed protein product [Brachionus calyciflorus]|uniref:Uncharacterized protein n=1 Tax=Brachionus calyciflorus TaxID=104777 RepID=A0A814B3A9_9BILA|nr:unnamed protein product [Brachionus calyciflorus]